MGWAKDAQAALECGQTIDVRPLGGSMRGKIESGQRVTIGPIDPEQVQVDDIVFVKWHGSHLLHLVVDLTETDALIGNNLGKKNGWTSRSAIVGKVVAVHDD